MACRVRPSLIDYNVKLVAGFDVAWLEEELFQALVEFLDLTERGPPACSSIKIGKLGA